MSRNRTLLSLLLVVMVVALSAASVLAQDEPLRVTYVVNGVLGDKSFFDSGQRGLDQVMDEFDVEVNTIELGIDSANWESGLDDAMADTDSYDVLVVGTWQMVEFLGRRAHQYPDKTFIIFDTSVAYADPAICVDGCTNVYSVLYKQNEGSFLAGVYAGAMSTSGLEGMNPELITGSIGGGDIPVINDFVVGYEQGACLVSPDAANIAQYVGGNAGWNDPARAKEITLAMFEQGADIVFNVAGGSGVGMFEAAQEQGHYALGVDSDQATIIMDTDPEQAERVLTSMMKNVDNSLFRAFELYFNDELPIGSAEELGIAEGGVGLAYNEIFDAATPDNVKELITAVEEAVIAGDIEVVSVFNEENPATAGMGCEAMPETTFDVAAFLSE